MTLSALEPEQYLNETELSELIRVHRRTAARLRAEGTGPPFVKFGGSIRYRRAAVDAWIAERESVSVLRP